MGVGKVRVVVVGATKEGERREGVERKQDGGRVAHAVDYRGRVVREGVRDCEGGSEAREKDIRHSGRRHDAVASLLPSVASLLVQSHLTLRGQSAGWTRGEGGSGRKKGRIRRPPGRQP